LVVTASADNTARLWETASGKQLAVLGGHSGEVRHAAFSPDSQLVVTASADNTARLWEAASGKQLAVLGGHRGEVWHAAFSPDSQWIVTASTDRTARLWDSHHYRPPEYSGRKAPNPVRSPDKQSWVKIEKNGTAFLLGLGDDFYTRLQELKHEKRVLHADFSHDGRWIVTTSADNTACLWDVVGGEPPKKLNGHQAEVLYATFSFDDQYVVTGSADGFAILWNVKDGRFFAVLPGHNGRVTHAAFSHDNKYVVTASDDNTARLWKVGSGELPSALLQHNDPVKLVSFSKDDTNVIITVSGNDLIRLWHVKNGLPTATAMFRGERILNHENQYMIVESENVARPLPSFLLKTHAKLHIQALQDEASRRIPKHDKARLEQYASKSADIKKQKSSPPDYGKLGDIYTSVKDFNKASDAYKKQTKINPQDIDTWKDYGETLKQLGKYEEAKEAFENGLKLNSNRLALLSNDAELALIQGDTIRLKERFEKAKEQPFFSKSQHFVILPFLVWLADPVPHTWENLKQAFGQLTTDISIDWEFDAIEKVIKRLDDSSQKKAKLLIAFFKDWKDPKNRDPQTLLEQLETTGNMREQSAL
jgi:WD40 repeat protein